MYKLASDLEKNKLLEEKKEFRETQAQKKEQKKGMVDTIEAFYKDKINMLKERIETERFERKIAQQAQSEVSKNFMDDFSGAQSHEKRSDNKKETGAREVPGVA